MTSQMQFIEPGQFYSQFVVPLFTANVLSAQPFLKKLRDHRCLQRIPFQCDISKTSPKTILIDDRLNPALNIQIDFQIFSS